MPRLLVSEICPSRVFRADGECLRKAIENRWTDEEVLELDFAGERIASASFFDEGIGVLALAHPIATITRRLRPVGLGDADRALLNSIIQRRVQERALLRSDSANDSGGKKAT
jgi:hypothetical protein